jgi:hypothetical protein
MGITFAGIAKACGQLAENGPCRMADNISLFEFAKIVLVCLTRGSVAVIL